MEEFHDLRVCKQIFLKGQKDEIKKLDVLVFPGNSEYLSYKH